MVYFADIPATSVNFTGEEGKKGFFQEYNVWPETEGNYRGYIDVVYEDTRNLSPGSIGNYYIIDRDRSLAALDSYINYMEFDNRQFPVFYRFPYSKTQSRRFTMRFHLIKDVVPERLFYRILLHSNEGYFYVKSLVIPSGVTEIKEYAFARISGDMDDLSPDGLQLVNIPSSLTKIGDKAFLDNYFTTNIVFGNNLTEIGESVFEGCHSSGTTISFPGSLLTIPEKTFYRATGFSNILMGEGIKNIGRFSFRMEGNYPNLVFPSTIENIYAWGTFGEVNSQPAGGHYTPSDIVRNITFLSQTPPTITNDYAQFFTTFVDVDQRTDWYGKTNFPNVTIYVPAQSVQAYKTAPKWNVWADCIEAIPE